MYVSGFFDKVNERNESMLYIVGPSSRGHNHLRGSQPSYWLTDCLLFPKNVRPLLETFYATPTVN